jgi:hypothetical protein
VDKVSKRSNYEYAGRGKQNWGLMLRLPCTKLAKKNVACQSLKARMKQLLTDCTNSPKKKVRQGVCSKGKCKLKNCVLVCLPNVFARDTTWKKWKWNRNETEMTYSLAHL